MRRLVRNKEIEDPVVTSCLGSDGRAVNDERARDFQCSRAEKSCIALEWRLLCARSNLNVISSFLLARIISSKPFDFASYVTMLVYEYAVI